MNVQLPLFDLGEFTLVNSPRNSEADVETTLAFLEPPVNVEAIQLILPGFEPYFEIFELEPEIF